LRAWLRLPPSEALALSSDEGARVYLKTGHLNGGQMLPETGQDADQKFGRRILKVSDRITGEIERRRV